MQISGQYVVTFISDEELPPEQDFALLEVDGDVYLAIKQSRVAPCVLEEAWQLFCDRFTLRNREGWRGVIQREIDSADRQPLRHLAQRSG